MTRTFANYHAERAAFRQLFAGGCDKRILLFKGYSGSGKSSLLKACLTENSTAKPIGIELRDSRVGVEGILSRSALSIGKEQLPLYTQCAQDIASHKQQVNVSNVIQKGESNSLTVTLNETNQLAANEQRHTTLTEAWFEDVEQLDIPLVIAFDTFELAGSEVRNWLNSSFLSRAAFCTKVRVTIAGQQVPEPGIESWGQCHELYELFGVRDAREWMPVVEALGKQVPAANPLDWMAGTCNALKGNPSEIIKIIEALPYAGSVASGSNNQ
jgi:hypothetical protein